MAATKNIIGISIIEDNRFLRTAWSAALQAVPDMIVIGAYESCEEAFRSSDEDGASFSEGVCARCYVRARSS